MRSGNRARAVRVFLAILLLSALLPAAEKKNKAPESYSVVAGTVFREPGLALPGVEVTIAPAVENGTGKPPKKVKKLSFTTNTRGEFAFRLPSAKSSYIVAAALKGFKSQQKTVETGPEERVDVTFTLVAESK
jgi:hypothetical protein